ncbi:hypothetical protein LTSERUB_6739, partial [Salmonella enterica subsp. enterica serovar Rubislaw str. A4-653]
MVGDKEINRLLRLMELLLSPDNQNFEIYPVRKKKK